MRELYAPGKLFLAGEYSVLAPGRAALVLAVDRGLTMFASEAKRTRIEIPRWNLDIQDLAAPAEESADPRERFIRSLYQATAFRCPGAHPKHLVVDSPKNDLLARDLGLGTSATFAVNFARAFLPEESTDSIRVLALALESHRAIQDGIGSGADVATAWAGCSIRYTQSVRGAPTLQPLKASDRLALWFMYSGNPQRTSGAVKHFQHLEMARPRFVQRFREQSSKQVNQIQRGLNGPPALLVGSIERSGRLLSDLARQLGQAPPLPNLFQTALGLVQAAAKPSGAIGGDCIVVAARSTSMNDKIHGLGAAAGFELLNLNPVFGDQQ